MGMYDNIEFKATCDQCGQELSDFQSKDGPCNLAILSPRDVKNFYTSCNKCNTWHEWLVVPTQIEIIKLPITKIKYKKG